MNLNFQNYFQQRENVSMTHTQWQDFTKDYNNECKEKKNHQHLFCSIFGEGYKETFFVPKPHYPEKNSSESTIHTEEILIKQIDEYLEQKFQSKIPKGGNIVMYSSNSPCMKREKDIKDPCMFQLLVKAKQWYSRFKIPTTLLFTEFWGPIVSINLIDYDILHKFTKNCKFPIQLTRNQLWERLKEINEKQFHSMVPDKDKNILSVNIKGLKTALMKLAEEKESFSFKKHLIKAKKELPKHLRIQSQPARREIKETFLSVWSKMLESCSEKHNRAEITKKCNSAIVKNFLQNLESILGERSPIQFCQIPAIDGLTN
nr:PREDICTED: uncharacterized protein LOC109643759 [Paralichthys olivaceus]